MLMQYFQLWGHNNNLFYFLELDCLCLVEKKITQIVECIYACVYKLAKTTKVNVMVEIAFIEAGVSKSNSVHIWMKLFTIVDVC